METKQITVKRGFHGKYCQDNINLDGRVWQIHTSKGSKGIRSYAQQGDLTSDGNFSFMIFQDKNEQLIQNNLRATDSNLIAVHEQALKIFKEKYNIQ